jgi:hypothetical protein
VGVVMTAGKQRRVRGITSAVTVAGGPTRVGVAETVHQAEYLGSRLQDTEDRLRDATTELRHLRIASEEAHGTYQELEAGNAAAVDAIAASEAARIVAVQASRDSDAARVVAGLAGAVSEADRDAATRESARSEAARVVAVRARGVSEAARVAAVLARDVSDAAQGAMARENARATRVSEELAQRIHAVHEQTSTELAETKVALDAITARLAEAPEGDRPMLRFDDFLPISEGSGGGKDWVRKKTKELTGFTSPEAFVATWELLDHDGAASRMLTYQGTYSQEAADNPDRRRAQAGRPNAHRGWKMKDMFFYWWFLVKTGCDQTIAALLFKIPYSTATKAFVSMTVFQDSFWLEQFPTPTLEEIKRCAPEGFRKVYGTDRITSILDCSEIFIEKPSALEAQRACWSEYKHHCTLKFCSSITPGGATKDCSDGFPGRITDTAIVRVCGFLDRMRPGEEVAADEGFEQVGHYLAAIGCKLTYPPKKFPNVEFTAEEMADTAAQANLRIHIERAYGRVKSYRYLGTTMRISQVDLAGKIFRIVFFVANNFKTPLRNV